MLFTPPIIQHVKQRFARTRLALPSPRDLLVHKAPAPPEVSSPHLPGLGTRFLCYGGGSPLPPVVLPLWVGFLLVSPDVFSQELRDALPTSGKISV